MFEQKKSVHGSKTPGCTVVLGMGGTIAGRATEPGDTVGYVAGQVPVQELLAGIPAAKGLWLESEQVAQVDSKDMTHALWLMLASRVAHHLARPEVTSVVITHGTDTAEETAFFLQTVLRPDKPVVIACAMRPVTAVSPDGPQNLNDAFCLVQHPGAQGVMLVCAGWVHAAQDVSKVHTTDLNAFSSGDAGALARVLNHRVEVFRPWQVAGSQERANLALALLQQAPRWPRVEVLVAHADNDGVVVEALLAQQAAGRLQLDGLVVAGTGNGRIHEAMHAPLQAAQQLGVRVVVASRCVNGRVVAQVGDEYPDSAGLSPVKARLALTLALLGLSD